MSLTLPNLDDRTFADLTEEARSLLAAHAPAFTNHNPSDPLVTLTELFAYFTEVLLYRVNAVTDANRSAFLRLLNGPPDPNEQDGDAPPTREEIDAAIRTTVLNLRRVERAVTAADFERLALTADSQKRIARARCVLDADLESFDPDQRYLSRRGHVSVVIVPFQPADLAVLVGLVSADLDPRRLLGTRVHVVGPRFVPITVRVTLHVRPDAASSALGLAVEALNAYFHPLTGRDGTGWPFGRNVHVSEVYRLLDGVAGVDHVSRTAQSETQELNELSPGPGFEDRAVSNDVGELASVALEPDELVEIATDLSIRVLSA